MAKGALKLNKEVLDRFIDKMPWIKRSSKGLAMTFNVLIKKEDDIYMAHCLELDIVATGDTEDQVRKDIASLISTQVDYAFSNDNLENLYHPAPAEVWQEFFSCKKQTEERYKTESFLNKDQSSRNIIPHWIITNTCRAPATYHV